MSKAKEPEADYEPTDTEKHYALHADPNRERWNSGLYDVPPSAPPDAGGGVNLPKATGLTPAGCAIGDPDLVLAVEGLNFTADVLIVFDGTPIVTRFVSATELECDLLPSAFAEARGYPVTVQQGRYVNPTATMFTVTDPTGADLYEAPPHHVSKKNRRK